MAGTASARILTHCGAGRAGGGTPASAAPRRQHAEGPEDMAVAVSPDHARRAALRPWAVLWTLCLGLFMLLLDGTIVNIAIPTS